jgi:hypothetical protein
VDTLTKIKKLVVGRRIAFTHKAQEERIADGLSVDDIVASILNANAIKKTIRSRSPFRKGKRERLYVIESPNYDGVWIYTKGTIRKVREHEVFYILISSKLAT